MASRDLEDLAPELVGKAQDLEILAEQNGTPVLIYCTRRSAEEQARLYRKGRPTKAIEAKAAELDGDFARPDLADLLLSVGPQYGSVVTHAGPGQSIHQYGLAFDAVPLRDGKPVWSTEEAADWDRWQAYGEVAKELGLEWAGDWVSFTEYPHVQAPDADWRELIRG